MALTRLPMYKVYTDITGKPTFNQYGFPWKMQKPKSGMFMVYNIPGKEYLILGCGHLDSRTYALPLVQDVQPGLDPVEGNAGRDLWKKSHK